MKALTRDLSRRQFIGHAGGVGLLALLGCHGRPYVGVGREADFVFLEAEGFDDHGGWDLDQQSMDQMGSPYLLAHGLGVPVNDAATTVAFPSAGTYRVWVRTRDWVAPWDAPGAPGKFQLLVDGTPLDTTFGTEGADWHWQDGGTVEITGDETAVALHDLTGFEGRCEAVLFCKDTAFEPSNELGALTRFRRAMLGLPDEPDDGGSFDLVVVGGGLAGTCAAISAARQGLSVALVQDRPVLGGNGSSEVRVWPEGIIQVPPFEHVGDIVAEILRDDHDRQGGLNGRHAEYYDDQRKLDVVAQEPRITLLTEQRAFRVESTGGRVVAVVAQHTRTARWTRIAGRFFADCTGDATVGHLAKADYEFTTEHNMGSTNLWRVMDASQEESVIRCECKDKEALSAAFEAGDVAQPFPRCPWAIDLSDKPFPGDDGALWKLGGWFWESGFDKNPIEDIERIRDLNFRAMYGAWDAIKNVKGLYPNHRLGWAAFIAGKRESRRLVGDLQLDAEDFINARAFEDIAFPCSWDIDLHTPDPRYSQGHEGDAFISEANFGEYQGPYWAPYRTLYSRNIDNLFMAGRNISVTKDGLGAVRVMKTCGMMGEVVGKAAAICVRQQTTPRGVYADHLEALHGLMRQPGATRVG
ncbi:MAG: FAD-dependent oxidoreductase [Planctomycetota bacterium]